MPGNNDIIIKETGKVRTLVIFNKTYKRRKIQEILKAETN